MNKYYKYNVGKRKVVFTKVCGENPEHLPAFFKESKLICIKRFSLQLTGLISRFQGEITNEVMIDNETLNNELNCYNAVEISEEDYNLNLEKLKKLRDSVKSVYEDLRSYESSL